MLQDRVHICAFELYREKNTAEVHNIAEKQKILLWLVLGM